MVKIEADLTAVVWKIVVAVGDAVEEGDDLVVLESMKMEIPVESVISGVVAGIHVAEGDSVSPGTLIATIE
ncbi:biotin/lipoyl-binding carrier protein [Homoserinimonas sp. A447]